MDSAKTKASQDHEKAENLQLKVNKLGRQIKGLEDDKAKIEKDNTKLEDTIKELKEKLTDAEEKPQGDLKRLNDKVKDITKEKNNLDIELSAAISSKTQALNDKREAERSRDKYKSQVCELEGDLETNKKQLSTIKNSEDDAEKLSKLSSSSSFCQNMQTKSIFWVIEKENMMLREALAEMEKVACLIALKHGLDAEKLKRENQQSCTIF